MGNTYKKIENTKNGILAASVNTIFASRSVIWSEAKYFSVKINPSARF